MRLFVGMPVPGADSLSETAAALKSGHDDLRLVPDGTWHVTLRFLGDVASEQARAQLVASLEDALAGAKGLDCTVAGLGTFPPADRARVVWAGVDAPGIKRFVERVNSATALYGRPPDPRPFHAHVTLGRMKVGGDFRRDIARHRQTVFGQGRLDEVVLWSSELTPSGPVYEPVARWSTA